MYSSYMGGVLKNQQDAHGKDGRAEKPKRRRRQSHHRVRDSSFVSRGTPLEDLVSLSPKLRASGRWLFAFNEEDTLFDKFDNSSDDEEEKIPMSHSKPKVAPITQGNLRIHQRLVNEAQPINLNNQKPKGDSTDSFTSISTDIQNAIHYDLLDKEIYNS